MSTNEPVTPPEPTPAARGGGVTRAGALWSALIIGFLILIVLLIFITQNTVSAPFQFLNWHWSLPLGVAILLSAAIGALLASAIGTARILQLRRSAKRPWDY